MLYNLIAFRHSHADYCRGCLMAETPEELKIQRFEDLDALAVQMADYEFFNKTSDREWGDWSFMVMFDGKIVLNHLDGDEDEMTAEEQEQVTALWERHRLLATDRVAAKKASDEAKERAAQRRREEEAKARAAFDAEVAALKIKHNIK